MMMHKAHGWMFERGQWDFDSGVAPVWHRSLFAWLGAALGERGFHRRRLADGEKSLQA
jgi:hypothetical protein